MLGFSLALRGWDLAAATALQLGLQFAGLFLGGSLTFVAHGTKENATPAHPGSRLLRRVAPALAALLLAALLAVQVGGSTSFAHADLAREAAEAARDEIRRLPEVGLVELTAQFTTTESDPSTEAVLVKAMVRPRGDGAASALASKVREAIERRVRALDPQLRTFVRVDVLPKPAMQ